ncbi:MAG: VOC family protein [Bacteroidota bacterium]
MKKVTGIGGVFFKSKDVAKLKEWYRNHLGFVVTEWGSTMPWIDPETKAFGQTAWSPFKETSDYFAPSTLPYMINYRVHDVHALVEQLQKDGVTIAGGPDDTDYGKFAWIMDPEGRKIELWEAVDEGLGDLPPAWNEKVIDLNGISFKSDQPDKMNEWYKKHLDVGSNTPPLKVFFIASNDEKFFAETDKPYIYQYQVRDIHALLDQLKSANITTSTITETKDGKFGWCIDLEGNKVALWQA